MVQLCVQGATDCISVHLQSVPEKWNAHQLQGAGLQLAVNLTLDLFSLCTQECTYRYYKNMNQSQSLLYIGMLHVTSTDL